MTPPPFFQQKLLGRARDANKQSKEGQDVLSNKRKTRVQASLSKSHFRADNFMCTGESPRNLSMHPQKDDACSMSPCTEIQGRTSVASLKSLSQPPRGSAPIMQEQK